MLKIILFAILFFAIPSFVAAQVIVNEIAWMGTEIEGVESRQWWRYEWLELQNTSDQDVQLTGWSIELHRENLDFTIPLRGTISGGEYFVVGASNKINGIDLNYATLIGKFANSGQRVVLKNATGKITEEVDATQGWFAGDNEIKLTMERRFSDRSASDKDNWGSSMAAGGTLGCENRIFEQEAILNLDINKNVQAAKKKRPCMACFLCCSF